MTEEFIKTLLPKPNSIREIKVGDKLLIEVEVTQINYDASNGYNNMLILLEKGVENPATCKVEYKRLRTKAKVNKPNLVEKIREFAKAMFKTSDDDELDELIEQFGGVNKIKEVLQAKMLEDAMASMKDQKPTLPTNNA